jgi:hypothetical protein
LHIAKLGKSIENVEGLRAGREEEVKERAWREEEVKERAWREEEMNKYTRLNNYNII